MEHTRQPPKKHTKMWLIIGAVFVVLVAAMAARVALRDDTHDAPADVRDSAKGRREMAATLTQKFKGRGTLETEGPQAEGLVVKVEDCTLQTLSEIVHSDSGNKLLTEFNVRWVRCEKGGMKLTAPYQLH
jgi:hypothetical protein